MSRTVFLNKNVIWGWIIDAKTGGLEKQKQAFRIIRVAKYEFSGSCEIWILISEDVQQMINIDHFGKIGSDV